MNPLRSICLLACLLAATVSATPSQRQQNAAGNSLKPSDWLSASELQSIPALDRVTLEQLESMSVQEGAKLTQKLYHLSQINHDLSPSFVPSPNNIPTHILKPNGEKVSINLNQLVAKAKQQQYFGDEEVTILITGLPQQSETVKKATRKLVQAYMQRYNGQQQQEQQRQSSQKRNKDDDNDSKSQTSSEENYSSDSWKPSNGNSGNLIIIDLGSTLTNFKRFAMLDVEQTGAMIGKVLVQLTNQVDVPQEIIHVVAQGIASHVAGAAGRQFTRLTGNQLRRITALDPSRIMAKNANTLSGLARGDAEFVDAIHTSVYGMGTPMRVGDVDFYPNGPSASVPGADNVVEASMRATRYFAESVRPGNERNFPAVAASSLEEYKKNNGHGKRAYMGIATNFDLEGDYILQVNPKAPFGKSAPAQKQNTYHGIHQFKNDASNTRDNE